MSLWFQGNRHIEYDPPLFQMTVVHSYCKPGLLFSLTSFRTNIIPHHKERGVRIIFIYENLINSDIVNDAQMTIHGNK